MRHVYMSRMDSLTSDFMLDAAYLNPQTFFDEDEDMAGNAELSHGFNKYIARYAKHIIPIGPNHDRDVETLIRCINKQAFDAQRKLVGSSVAMFGAQEAIEDMAPAEWWHMYGTDFSQLRTIANFFCLKRCVRHHANEIGARTDLYIQNLAID